MKKVLRTAAVCLAACILGVVLAAAVTEGTGVESAAVTASADVRGTEDAVSAPAYMVKEYNGVVAVFSKGEVAPTLETDIFVSGLRSSDRELMRRGIGIETYSEVLCLLEDLNS